MNKKKYYRPSLPPSTPCCFTMLRGRVYVVDLCSSRCVIFLLWHFMTSGKHAERLQICTIPLLTKFIWSEQLVFLWGILFFFIGVKWVAEDTTEIYNDNVQTLYFSKKTPLSHLFKKFESLLVCSSCLLLVLRDWWIGKEHIHQTDEDHPWKWLLRWR